MRAFSQFRVGLAALSLCSVMGAEPQPDQKTSENELLKDVKVPDGFYATIFAAPPMANYPVFIAAATDGTLYVSSDGNGSLGRDPHRGRILRLRDLDGDGRADEVKEFVKDVDSPRGLVWDHDRLYLLHPPHISEYIDMDGDGISDEERILVKNIGWTFKDRPADHASNGMELGIDGWLYCAIGDFGFMEAEGTDGRKIQLRGGGVVRVRPDGTGLHIYSRGTRNILEPAVSPLLDVITRDNTNDGGGWDVRLHHNTGLANHGYPSLFKNFNDEIIQPLADYGGGSGCGAAWIDEPGIPAEWNNAPFTCDWGRNWVYAHRLTPKGATFTADQKQFIGLTRPTDLDVDGNSRIYIASWKGATFNWAGPNVGYIVQLRPKNFTPAPLPDFNKASAKELVTLLTDKSHRRRLEAQRTLVRKNLAKGSLIALRATAIRDGGIDNPRGPIDLLSGRIAAIYAVALAGLQSNLVSYASDSAVRAYVTRALGEPDRKATENEIRVILGSLKSTDAKTKLQAIVATGFQNLSNVAPQIAGLLADSDPVVSHTAIESLKILKADDACWPIIDSSASPQRGAALNVVQLIHTPAVVDALTTRLQAEKDSTRRLGLFTALARLHSTEGNWKGDSWGTRPDTSGPYYQTESWTETPRILRALNDTVEHATPEELPALATELNRHKIHSDAAITKVVAAASSDSKLIPITVAILSRAEKVPAEAESILAKAARDEQTPATTRAEAVLALSKSRSSEALQAGFTGLSKLEKADISDELRRRARTQFLNNPALADQLPLLETEADHGNIIADAAIVVLGDRRGGNRDAFNKAWENPERRPQLLNAVALAERRSYSQRVLDALDDPDPKVAEAARETARALRLERRRNSPKIETLTVTNAIAAVVRTRGDIELGKKLFTQQTCVNCHTVSEKEPQSGPYLGTIAATYKRPELTEAILNPNKSIAQGFVGNHFEMKNGDQFDGFVTLEAADKVTIRDTAAQEHTLEVKEISKREKLDKSLMPEGLAAPLSVQELASLVDYLESLNAK